MLLKCCTQYGSKFGKFSSGHRNGKASFHSKSKERQCQRMLKLLHNCTHLTCLQRNHQILQARLQQHLNHELFPVVMYGCESWTIMKAEHQRIDAFELWCWRQLLRVPWTARRSNRSILKEISPEYSLQGLMMKLKLQYFELTHWKRP